MSITSPLSHHGHLYLYLTTVFYFRATIVILNAFKHNNWNRHTWFLCTPINTNCTVPVRSILQSFKVPIWALALFFKHRFGRSRHGRYGRAVVHPIPAAPRSIIQSAEQHFAGAHSILQGAELCYTGRYALFSKTPIQALATFFKAPIQALEPG